MERWWPMDIRTGARMSQMTWPSKETLDREIEAWRERDREGGRPDLHEKMPFIVAHLDDSPIVMTIGEAVERR